MCCASARTALLQECPLASVDSASPRQHQRRLGQEYPRGTQSSEWSAGTLPAIWVPAPPTPARGPYPDATDPSFPAPIRSTSVPLWPRLTTSSSGRGSRLAENDAQLHAILYAVDGAAGALRSTAPTCTSPATCSCTTRQGNAAWSPVGPRCIRSGLRGRGQEADELQSVARRAR